MIFETLVSGLLLSVFGNPMIIGAFLMLMFFLMSLAFRLTPEMQILFMVGMIFFIIGAYAPELKNALILVLGVSLGVFLFYRILGR